MGCAISKIDELPTVVLCRQRLGYLDQALHLRYAYADAHLAYFQSLNSLADSLHRFFQSSSATGLPRPSPHPKGQKADSSSASSSGHLSLSNSSSGSHLHFHSGSDSDSDSDDHHLHHDADDSASDGSLRHDSRPSSATRPTIFYENPDGFIPYPIGGGVGQAGYMHMNYMRRPPTPSLSYHQKPLYADPHTLEMGPGESSSYSSSNPHPTQSHPFYAQNQIPTSYDYANSYGHMNYAGGGPGMGGFFGASTSSSSSSKPAPPPPPPPPPSTSAWEFLNPFESIETTYPSYAPSSRDSREAREQEGIPDLEHQNYGYEVVEEVHGSHKSIDETSSTSTSSSGGGNGQSDPARVEDAVGEGEAALYRGRPSASSPQTESNPLEYEVHVVVKKVVEEEGKSECQAKAGFKDVFEFVQEIQVQFLKASHSGIELSKVLEVGKLPYQPNKTSSQVSSKMLNVITPSLPSISKASAASLDPDEEMQLRSLSLSATLHKLCLWETKLLEEVKVEEKMRVMHDKKLRKLKLLDEQGAEAHKIDSIRSTVKRLSTKIRISIQVVEKISIRVNTLRDEELWPQLNELIQGLSRMWKAVLECHHSQCQAIDGASGLDAIVFANNPSDTQLEATLQLEHDLINWTYRFTEWVGAQKGFVRALNAWLLKCLLCEPEVTADGIAPFSPGGAGAPPIFVICNQWNQSLERISKTSEKQVVDSMRVFAMMVWHFRERDKGEMCQRMTANRDMEKKVKILEREDMKIQKEIQALDKKIVLASGGSDALSSSGHVYQSDACNKTSLESGLRHIFEAMDRFAADSVKAYEEILQRTEEVVHEHGKVL